MKDKIKKLFQGTREDMIIACSLLVNSNLDIIKFLKEWEELNAEIGVLSGYPRNYQGRVHILLTETNNPFEVEEGSFYYRISNTLYLYCNPGKGIAECWEVYNKYVEVINH